MPAACARVAAASMVTGNSLMRMPSAEFSATSASVSSSWLAIATSDPAKRASSARAVRCAQQGPLLGRSAMRRSI